MPAGRLCVATTTVAEGDEGEGKGGRQRPGPTADLGRVSRYRAMETRRARRLIVVAHEVRTDGGMERAMFHTIQGLLERGWTIDLISRVNELPPHPQLNWRRVTTPRRPFALAFPLFALVAGVMLRAMRRDARVVSLGAIVPNRVDVVTVQFCHAGFAAHGEARRVRDSRARSLNDLVGRALALGFERWCYRPSRLRRMTAVSDLIRNELLAHFRLADVPIDVVPNGVDLARFSRDDVARRDVRSTLGVTDDDLLALFVGGDWRRKGLGVAIEASARAGWVLVVVGYGDPDDWSSAVETHGARVIFHGTTPTPESLFSAADAFLLPSSYEGFALVTVEAAAAGLPLLVTTATGAGPLVRETGSEPLRRDPAAFAAELQTLSDARVRAERGSRAHAAARALAWPRIVDGYEVAYGAER